MAVFNGRLFIAAGEFKTIGELIRTAIAARVYSIIPSTQTRQVEHMQGAMRGTESIETRIVPENNIYMADAWKGNNNGVIDQAQWDAGDFTASPGGGELLDGGVERLFMNRIGLDSRIVYAAADSYIDIDVTTPIE